MEVDQKLVVTIPYYGTAEAEKKSQELQELYIKLGYAWVVYVDNEPRHLDKPYIVLDKDSNRFYFTTYLIGNENLMDFDTAISEAEKQLQKMELTPEFETEASEPGFKVGDKVYVGLAGKIVQVTGIIDDDVVSVANKNNEVRAGISYICHATRENYERLQATFPDIEFEAPPKPLTGSDLCFEKLRNSKKLVICAVSDISDERAIKRLQDGDTFIRVIKDCNPTPYHFIDTYGIRHGFAVPLNDETGEPLTESILND